MAEQQDPTRPAGSSGGADDGDEGKKPFYKSPLKLLGAMWVGKKILGGSVSKARTHRRRTAIKELRAEQRERKRRERSAEARAALRHERRADRRAHRGPK